MTSKKKHFFQLLASNPQKQFQLPSAGSVLIHGERHRGQDVRTQNVNAAIAIANVVRSSLGPNGFDKLLVDNIGEFTSTNDGATILKKLEVTHPASKVLVQLAGLQDEEVGDGTTSVVLIAAELIKRGDALIRKGIHATNVMSGYRIAMRESLKFLKNRMAINVSELDESSLLNAAMTTMSSKIINVEAPMFAKMAVEAMKNVGGRNGKYPVRAIHILKSHGKSMKESILINGLAVNALRGDQQMPARCSPAKVALVDFSLQAQKLGLQVHVKVTDVEDIEKIRERELEVTRERVEMLLNAGANVVITSGSVDAETMKQFVKANAMCIRHVARDELNRIKKATGARIMISLADLEGGESFESEFLGQADEVVQEWVGDQELVIMRGTKEGKSQSIILRGPNRFMLDEISRALHDALCVVSTILESRFVVPGGGACEGALSVYLEEKSRMDRSKAQLSIAEFANSLLIIPKQLSVNAACDSIDLVAKLRASFHLAMENEEPLVYGLDLDNEVIRDSIEAGVIEPLISKMKMLKFATEAAITILRIDEMIQITPDEQKEDPRER